MASVYIISSLCYYFTNTASEPSYVMKIYLVQFVLAQFY